MLDRRQFLRGLLAVGAVVALPGRSGWAGERGAAILLSSARAADGRDYAVAWQEEAGIVWQSPLAARAHGPVVSPVAPVAAFPARRPGSFVRLLGLDDGRVLADWAAPPERSFQGHAIFVNDGATLLTSEIRFDATLEDGETGVLGVWEVASGRRLGEIPTHGVEPHELRLLSDDRTLAVANGGILTSADTRRVKLNIADMRSSLVYLDAANGRLLERVEPEARFSRLSLRHLSEAADGTLLVAAQYQGNPADTVPLLATHRRGEGLYWLDLGAEETRSLRHYCGSIAALPGGGLIATSPPGGLALHRSAQGTTGVLPRPDVCGVAVTADQVILTTGFGEVLALDPQGGLRLLAKETVKWDNHAVFGYADFA